MPKIQFILRGSINQVALIALRLICTQFFLCSVLFPGVSISVCNVLFVQAFLYPDGFTHVHAFTIFNIFLLLSHLCFNYVRTRVDRPTTGFLCNCHCVGLVSLCIYAVDGAINHCS